MPAPRMPVAERFATKYEPEPMTGCWLWTAGVRAWDRRPIFTRPGGYGSQLAYRTSWEIHRGPIPDGLFVCHKCDTPCCVNPDHLFLGTMSQNSLDMHRKGRAAKPPVFYGEDAHRAKLKTEQVTEIRRRAANGEIRYRLAREYGVSPAAVYQLCARNSWKHVP